MTTIAVTAPTWHAPTTLNDVEGWFYPRDQAVMTWLLDRQERSEPAGDLLELGSYLGKSAILIGTHLRAGERFTVCDLFGSAPTDDANQREQNGSYRTLTRQGFERNYLAFHPELPAVVQSTTDQITEHVASGSCRFVHVDASHLWEHVHGDIEAARELLRPDGLVVCDDYRSEHTPGVAAAVWTAVANGGLRPICVTGNKFYGTWGDPDPVQNELVEWLDGLRKGLAETQHILGHRLVRVRKWPNPPLPEVRARHAGQAPRSAVPAPAAGGAARRRTSDRPWWASPRTIARELLPPVVTRAIRKSRAR